MLGASRIVTVGKMNGSFNASILVDKLAKLNNSQQSIETLSHWCIFHRNKARQVVETWERQFHCAPRDQRVSFLYLANDILQNSRRRGIEFITEFWRVLPNALNDVLRNGDDFGKNAAIRLIDIWEERKVFGSRGQLLRDELMLRNSEDGSKNVNGINYRLKRSGEVLEKLTSGYESISSACNDEGALFGKCQMAMNFFDKVERELGDGSYLENNSAEASAELQGQFRLLKESVERLKTVESCRSSLISVLRDALHEQEVKNELVQKQLQVAQSRLDQAGIACQKVLGSDVMLLPVEEKPHDVSEVLAPAKYVPVGAIESAQVAPTEALSLMDTNDGIGQVEKDECYSESKKAKLDDPAAPYIPQPQAPPPPPPYPFPESLQQPPPPPSPPQSTCTIQQPLQAPLLPSLPPIPIAQFMPGFGGAITGIPPPPYPYVPPSYAPMLGMPPFQPNFQGPAAATDSAQFGQTPPFQSPPK